MRYAVKQRLLAWDHDFTIKNEQGDDCYFVQPKRHSLSERLAIQDRDGNELVRIEEKLLSWGQSYEIYRGYQRVAKVRKKMFHLFRDVFELEDPAHNLDADGDFRNQEYRFTRDGQPVATVSRESFPDRDVYGVDIVDGEDNVLILAMAVVIDMIAHQA